MVRAARVGERIREVRLEAVGQVVDLVLAEVVQGRPDGGGVHRDVVGQRQVRDAHLVPSVPSRRPMVAANSCHSLRWASSIARPWLLMP